MLKCSYCKKGSSPLDLLLCCLNLACQGCAQVHPCPSQDSLSLHSKLPTIKTCKRCGIQPIQNKCNQCNMFFCQECMKSVHSKGKYLNHTILGLASINSNDLMCNKHDKRKNVVMGDCSLGCIRCVEEYGTRRVVLTEEVGQEMKQGVLASILDQKEQTIRYQKQAIAGKWESMQKTIRDAFQKLKVEIEERHGTILGKIKGLRQQQIQTAEQLLTSISVLRDSWDSLQIINVPNKQKIVSAKQMLISENFKLIDRKRRLISANYHVGKLEVDSLVSVIKGLGFLQRVKEEVLMTEQKRRQGLLDSNQKDRRSQSREMSRSRLMNMNSGTKTRQGSASKHQLQASKQIRFGKLGESSIQQMVKNRLKSQVYPLASVDDLRKSELLTDKFKDNFLQMKQNIRKGGSYFNQRSTTRR